jgi:two-component system, OmpR family, sensor histidine kinase MprB
VSLRLKIVLALVLLATCATAAVGFSSYVSTRHELNEVVDRSLQDAASDPRQLVRFFGRGPGGFPGRGFGSAADGNGPGGAPPRVFDSVLAQFIDTSGTIVLSPQSGQLPVDAADRAVADGSFTGTSEPRDVNIQGESFRMLTIPFDGAGAVQIARSARDTENALAVIRERTLLSVALVIIGATILGWLIGRQVTRRLVRLTHAADAVATTGRLDVEVPVSGSDETGRLGLAFNGMLGALARSRDQQRQLVQDAGHELRTPLTSLRTNVSVLRRMENLAPEEREQLLDDLDSETKELTALVNELVELAIDRRDDEPAQECDLGSLSEQAAARVRRRTGREITVVSDGSMVSCRPAAIDRAVLNLIDNAAKFSAAGSDAGGVIEVEVAGGRVAVSDRGPGVPAEDLAHIFDRFYRSVASRSLPGSGLGLAIVRDIVESHGGTVFAEARPGGGLTVGFTLPTLPADSDAPSPPSPPTSPPIAPLPGPPIAPLSLPTPSNV